MTQPSIYIKKVSSRSKHYVVLHHVCQTFTFMGFSLRLVRCRKHENIQLKADRLHALKILTVYKAESVIKDNCCSVDSKLCMYRECEACMNNRIDFNEYDNSDGTRWYEWQLSDIGILKWKIRKPVSTKRDSRQLKFGLGWYRWFGWGFRGWSHTPLWQACFNITH